MNDHREDTGKYEEYGCKQLKDWFSAPGDLDDFIFYDNGKKTEKDREMAE